SRSWNGSEREMFAIAVAPPRVLHGSSWAGPMARGSGPLLLLVVVAFVDDLGVDDVTVGLRRAGLWLGRRRAGRAGGGLLVGRLPGRGVGGLGKLVSGLLQRPGGVGAGARAG